MADPLMDLVDATVVALTAGEFSLAFTARWKDDALAELSDGDLETPQVWVVDSAESLPDADGGVPLEEFGVLIVLQKKFAEDEDRPSACRNLSALAAEITRFCRATVLEGAVCVKTVRNPARNLDDYHNLDRFYAEIQTTWRRVYEDDDE